MDQPVIGRHATILGISYRQFWRGKRASPSFGREPLKMDAATVVIVVRARTQDEVRTVGLAVDAVSDAQSFAATLIKPAPDMHVAKAAKSLLRIATAERGMVLLLDLDGLNTVGLTGAIAA